MINEYIDKLPKEQQEIYKKMDEQLFYINDNYEKGLQDLKDQIFEFNKKYGTKLILDFFDDKYYIEHET